MGLFTKKTDPISERAQALTEEIAALEEQIKQLDGRLGAAQPPPRLRSTVLPHGANGPGHSPAPGPGEPIFEEVNQSRLKSKSDSPAPPEHFNELGVRKYDLAGFVTRVRNHFRPPPAANPKLVNYLAAGSIQGLRPMRFEKRVRRNQFLFLVIIILLALVGIWVMLGHR